MDEAWNNPFPSAESVLKGLPVSLAVHALCLELWLVLECQTPAQSSSLGQDLGDKNCRPELKTLPWGGEHYTPCDQAPVPVSSWVGAEAIKQSHSLEALVWFLMLPGESSPRGSVWSSCAEAERRRRCWSSSELD